MSCRDAGAFSPRRCLGRWPTCGRATAKRKGLRRGSTATGTIIFSVSGGFANRLTYPRRKCAGRSGIVRQFAIVPPLRMMTNCGKKPMRDEPPGGVGDVGRPARTPVPAGLVRDHEMRAVVARSGGDLLAGRGRISQVAGGRRHRRPISRSPGRDRGVLVEVATKRGGTRTSF